MKIIVRHNDQEYEITAPPSFLPRVGDAITLLNDERRFLVVNVDHVLKAAPGYLPAEGIWIDRVIISVAVAYPYDIKGPRSDFMYRQPWP